MTPERCVVWHIREVGLDVRLACAQHLPCPTRLCNSSPIRPPLRWRAWCALCSILRHQSAILFMPHVIFTWLQLPELNNGVLRPSFLSHAGTLRHAMACRATRVGAAATTERYCTSTPCSRRLLCSSQRPGSTGIPLSFPKR